ncbi:FAD-binding domain-containing protein [Gonapodya prolifera JEL478]|uniref:FAD-binding domain-containing protein n=1 Tax=Gonapodya prolifera (strain JEL478) TaxID=1344416 RepID=A0A138ZXD2_GONPJ|nr:FAD-binding domain-containing protein [Gonapodya prolifera JEL478]|eukprot:KXS09148.1 FAD-binding domain-containing protein [Gonapodya prolifera JEL478]
MTILQAIGGEGTTSHRLASIVAGEGKRDKFKTVVHNKPSAMGHKDYVLPPDVTENTFESFIEAVAAIVGVENVHVNYSGSAQDQSDYLNLPAFVDFFAIDDPERFMASSHIQPATELDVSEIVKAANKYLVPLHPISIGRNLGYGGSSPRLRGAAILDLKCLNRILEVNEESCFSLLEPGVSYFELYEHPRSKGSKLWIDCPDIGWGSIIGNTCERGAGYTPLGDHFMELNQGYWGFYGALYGPPPLQDMLWARSGYGFDFVNTLVIGMHDLHSVNLLIYDRADKSQRDRMRELIRACVDEGGASTVPTMHLWTKLLEPSTGVRRTGKEV